MEQITYLLFLRRLDDLQTATENKASRLGRRIESPVFPVGDDEAGRPYEDLRWSRFKYREPGDILGQVSRCDNSAPASVFEGRWESDNQRPGRTALVTMTRITRIVLALVAVLAITAVPVAASKPASPGKSKTAPHGKKKGFGKGVTKLKGGATTLDVDQATFAALTGAGFGVTPAAPATADGSVFSFPITKGRVHLGKGKKKRNSGYIHHRGGMTFSKDAVSLTTSNLRILLSSSKKVRVFAKVGDKRVRLLDLSNVTVTDGKILADAALARAAAERLNAAFTVTLFTSGMAMGKVAVTPGG